nr:MAG TPA: hypothetical protein [Caudoviricetes sp.]
MLFPLVVPPSIQHLSYNAIYPLGLGVQIGYQIFSDFNFSRIYKILITSNLLTQNVLSNLLTRPYAFFSVDMFLHDRFLLIVWIRCQNIDFIKVRKHGIFVALFFFP